VYTVGATMSARVGALAGADFLMSDQSVLGG
jgi:hypothetical protein